MFKIRKHRAAALLTALLLLAALLPAAARAAAPLVLQSAAVTPDGGIGLTFDRTLSGEDLVNRIRTGFTIQGLDRTLSILDAALYGSGSSFVQLTFSQPVRGGEAVAVSYTPGSVQALDGGLLAEIPSMDVENDLPHPTLVPGTPPPLVVGTPFVHTLGAVGGTAPYRFSVDSGQLPDGLTLSPDGSVSGTPTQAGVFTFAVLAEDANDALDLQLFIVPVQEAPAEVCEISGTGYQTLDAALSAVQPGGAATIRLLKDIGYSACITVRERAILFDLNGHTLSVVNTRAEDCGLLVGPGGSVRLTGSGAFHVTGESYGVRVQSGESPAAATVTSATASGLSGEAAYAAGTGASLTVLGDCSAPRSARICVHAINGAEIRVGGSVTAWNQGVYASGSRIAVDGSVTANGVNILDEPIGIGAGSFGGSVTIGGSVTANRVGVMARADGTDAVDGAITAPVYIQLGDDPLAPSDFTEPTTRAGYRTYTAGGLGTVWVKMPPAAYPVTVGGSYAQASGAGSYAEGAAVRLHAGTRSGYAFAGWTSADVTLSDPADPDAGFVMPGKAVSVTANWSAAADGGREETRYPMAGQGEQRWEGPAGGLTFRSGGPLSRFSGASVDGRRLSPAHYSLESGSTVVTLRPVYLRTLSAGRHTLRLAFDDGYSSASFLVAPASAAPSGALADVRETDWFFGDVRGALDAGWMKKTAENAFEPRAAAVRGAFAEALYRLEGEPTVGPDCPFADVSGGDSCRQAVIWAAQKRIAAGYAGGAFGPDAPVTREQAAVLLHRYAKYLGLDTAPRADLAAFPDAGSIGGYARDAMAWAVQAGLFRGTAGGRLAPGDAVSRAQLAALLGRFAARMTG